MAHQDAVLLRVGQAIGRGMLAAAEPHQAPASLVVVEPDTQARLLLSFGVMRLSAACHEIKGWDGKSTACLPIEHSCITLS